MVSAKNGLGGRDMAPKEYQLFAGTAVSMQLVEAVAKAMHDRSVDIDLAAGKQPLVPIQWEDVPPHCRAHLLIVARAAAETTLNYAGR